MEPQTAPAARTWKRHRGRHLPRDDLCDKEMRGGNFCPQSEHADLLSSLKNRCHHPRATVAMEHGNDPQRALVRGVGDQVIAHALKTQRACSEVLAAVSDVRKRNKGADRFKNFNANAPGRFKVFVGDEFPDIEDVLRRFRVKLEAKASVHCGECFNRSSSRWRNCSKKASPSTGFTRPLFKSS